MATPSLVVEPPQEGSEVGPRKRSRIGSQGSNYGDEMPHFEAQLASTHLEHLCLLDIFTQPHILRNTGIICTIGA